MPGPQPHTAKEAVYILLNNAIREGECLRAGNKLANRDIYFNVRADGENISAHRLIYAHFNPGKQPPVVRHSCHNKWCIEPSHLIGGTHAENVADKVNANRQSRGVTHYRAKLTEADVKAIRASDKNLGELSRQYGISRGGIKCIKDRLSWKHVE